jgi:creatinine deaminase
VFAPANMEHDIGFQAALEEARKGFSEGGVPIGAALVAADGTILGRGHNMRIQKGSATLHVCHSRCAYSNSS